MQREVGTEDFKNNDWGACPPQEGDIPPRTPGVPRDAPSSARKRYRVWYDSSAEPAPGAVVNVAAEGEDGRWGAGMGRSALPATQVALITHARFTLDDEDDALVPPRRTSRSRSLGAATPRGEAVSTSLKPRGSVGGAPGNYAPVLEALPAGVAGSPDPGTSPKAEPAGSVAEAGSTLTDVHESPPSLAHVSTANKVGAHLSGVLYGVVSVCILLPVILGYASILVGGPPALQPLLSRVAALQFLANGAFAGVYLGFDTATHATIGTIQDPSIIFFNAGARQLAAQCDVISAQALAAVTANVTHPGLEVPRCDTAALSVAVVLMVGIGTACSALGFLGLSFMPKLVQLVTYIPLPVVGGFLASVGAFILQGGLSLALQAVDPGVDDPSGWLASFAALTSVDNLAATLLTLTYALVLFVAVRVSSHPALLPTLIALPVPLFYLAMLLPGLSLQGARDAHLFFPPARPPGNNTSSSSVDTAALGMVGSVFLPLSGALAVDAVPVADALHLLSTTPGLFALLGNLVVAVVVATLLLNTLGVETTLALTNLDYQRELRLLAGSNFLSALVGGVPGGRNYTLTVLTHAGLNRGALGRAVKSRAAGATCVIAFLLVYLFDLNVMSIAPKFLFSGILVFVAMDLLVAWLVSARLKMRTIDFAVVWVSFLSIQWLGLNAGTAIAMLCSVLLFLVQYARVPVINRMQMRRANRFRLASERTLLASLEGAILYYRVEGVLFFGTSRQLVSVITKALDDLDARVAAQSATTPRPSIGAAAEDAAKGLRRRWRRGDSRVAAEGGGDQAGGAPVVRARFIVLDCGLLQGLDSSAAQTFTRLRRQVNSRGVVLVLCALPLHIERTLRREGVLTCNPHTPRPKALSFHTYDAAVEWCEDRLLGNSDSGSDDESGVALATRPLEASHAQGKLAGHSGIDTSVGSAAEAHASAQAAHVEEIVESFSVRVFLPVRCSLPACSPCGVCGVCVQAFLPRPRVHELLARFTTKRTYQTDESVFSSDHPAQSFFFVGSGHVVLLQEHPSATSTRTRRMVASDPGSVATRYRFQSVTPGGIVGDLDWVLGESRSFGCAATEPSTLYEMTVSQYQAMLQQRPDLAFALARVQLHDMCAHIKDVSFRRIIE